jgi:RNA polymerase-interacting CarD/CdnL/TRCF family regulator
MSSILDISSIGFGTTSMDIQSPWKERKQNWENLGNALNSGDMASALQAFAAVQQDLHKIQQRRGRGPQQFEQNIQNLQEALSSGEITAAQQVFSTIRQHRVQGELYRNGVNSRS